MASQNLLSRLKTRQVVKSADQVVKQEQSLEMVQSLMLVSFTTICNLRDLIPLDEFEDREFTFNSDSNKTKSSRPGRFKVIAPGKSSTSDKLIKWLGGINEALAKGYLESTQLSIIPSKDRPEHVIESYTFTFGYGPSSAGDKSSHRPVSSLNVSQNDGASVTLQSARYELGRLIRYLVTMCQMLPDLPDERFITVHLFYNDRRPEDWQPAGFGPNKSNEMLLVNSDDWQIQTADVGRAELGQHSMELGMKYLLPMANDPGRQYNEFKIDNALPFTEVTQRNQANVGKPLSQRVQSKPLGHEENESDSLSRMSSWRQSQLDSQAMDDEPVAAVDIPAARKVNPRRCGIPLTVPPRSSQASTIAQDVRVERRLLQMTKEISELPEDIGSTQPQAGQIVPQREIDFTPEVGARLMARHQSASANELSLVRCECGNEKQEGHLVRCSCCENAQHRSCYAIEAKEAAKQHVCYTCLLDGNDDERLDRMKYVAQLRCLLWKIQKLANHGSQTELMRHTGFDKELFMQLINEMKKRDLIRHQPKKRPPFRVLQQTVQVETEPGGLLHPLFEIDDLYRKISGDGQDPDAESEDINTSQVEHDTRGQPDPEIDVVRSDDETVIEELRSLGPKTPALRTGRTHSNVSYIIETPKRGRQADESATAMGPPAKRARQFNSSQAMSPANVSRHS